MIYSFMHVFWQVIWYSWAVIFLIIGAAIAIGRIDDWKDPEHKIGRPYKKTYYKD